jgi:hypothetical protein
MVQRRQMETDIREERDLYQDLENDIAVGYQLHFNPIEFNEERKPLHLRQYELSHEQLHQYAIKLTKIRRQVLERAMACQQYEPEKQREQQNERKRRGQIHSTKGTDR